LASEGQFAFIKKKREKEKTLHPFYNATIPATIPTIANTPPITLGPSAPALPPGLLDAAEPLVVAVAARSLARSLLRLLAADPETAVCVLKK